MAKKTEKAKVAKTAVKKVAKPATKPAAKAKPAVKSVTKKVVAKATTKSAPTAKKVAKPSPKEIKPVVTEKAAKKTSTNTSTSKKVVAKPVAKTTSHQKGETKIVEKAASKVAKKAIKKELPKTDSQKTETPKSVVAPKNDAAPAKKEVVKTVEQQMQEKQSTPSVSTSSKKGAKEELFVPKYSLEAAVEPVRPMRPKPPIPIIEETESKPVANPIFVPPAPDGKPGIKYAPIANLERPKEKEKTSISHKSVEEHMNSKTSPKLAFNDGDDKKGASIEAKLRALYAIQLIDSRIDKIHAMRGELPLEVEDLEDEVAGLETRLEKTTTELKAMTDEIAAKKQGIKDAEALIKKYKEQLNDVKNNREFDSLNKEIVFQELEIELHKKNIGQIEYKIEHNAEVSKATEGKLNERKNDLKLKQSELSDIITSTEKEEKILLKKSDEAKTQIEERLLAAYERIRSGSHNGTAVVPIEREASAGSYIQLPPQKQLDVAARKRIIVDEHSGRILVDAELAMEETEKMNTLLSKELK